MDAAKFVIPDVLPLKNLTIDAINSSINGTKTIQNTKACSNNRNAIIPNIIKNHITRPPLLYYTTYFY